MSRVNPILIAAALVAAVMTSGFVEINIQHHMNLPAALSNKNIVEVRHPLGLLDNPFNTHRTIHIRTAASIGSTDQYKEVTKALQDADSNDTVVFHVAGYGGRVDTVAQLLGNIAATRAKVIMLVESPSYSGHAYLSAAPGVEMHMLPNTFLMFHTTSAYGKDCNEETGTDRTVPNSEHCQSFMTAHLGLVNSMIDKITFLTAEEKALIKSGHDVYISADEYNRRMKTTWAKEAETIHDLY